MAGEKTFDVRDGEFYVIGDGYKAAKQLWDAVQRMSDFREHLLALMLDAEMENVVKVLHAREMLVNQWPNIGVKGESHVGGCPYCDTVGEAVDDCLDFAAHVAEAEAKRFYKEIKEVGDANSAVANFTRHDRHIAYAEAELIAERIRAFQKGQRRCAAPPTKG